MSHTPGPWHYTDHISPHLSIWAGNKKICEPFYCDGAGVARSNARLMAASPDLLLALQWYVENDDTNDAPGNEFFMAGKQKAIEAITKATGK